MNIDNFKEDESKLEGKIRNAIREYVLLKDEEKDNWFSTTFKPLLVYEFNKYKARDDLSNFDLVLRGQLSNLTMLDHSIKNESYILFMDLMSNPILQTSGIYDIIVHQEDNIRNDAVLKEMIYRIDDLYERFVLLEELECFHLLRNIDLFKGLKEDFSYYTKDELERITQYIPKTEKVKQEYLLTIGKLLINDNGKLNYIMSNDRRLSADSKLAIYNTFLDKDLATKYLNRDLRHLYGRANESITYKDVRDKNPFILRQILKDNNLYILKKYLPLNYSPKDFVTNKMLHESLNYLFKTDNLFSVASLYNEDMPSTVQRVYREDEDRYKNEFYRDIYERYEQIGFISNEVLIKLGDKLRRYKDKRDYKVNMGHLVYYISEDDSVKEYLEDLSLGKLFEVDINYKNEYDLLVETELENSDISFAPSNKTKVDKYKELKLVKGNNINDNT